MLCRKVVAVLSLCFLAYGSGMPQNSNNDQDSAGLPLLQFTNGGIRVNFGGYHAQAGLGGLLGGSNTGGGLHASAGTPWGANAAAGLGGLLGGNNANAGGGLYARAGLGNGRPEAAAGLGGLLDGSGRSNSPVSGGLFAGATTGARGVSAGTATGRSANGGATDGNNEIRRATSGGANIQIIEKRPRKVKLVSSEVERPAETLSQTDPPANKEIREVQSTPTGPLLDAGVLETLSVNPQASVTKTVVKVKTIGSAIEQAPPVPPLPDNLEEVVNDNRPYRVKVVYPKRVVRKRFWGPRKQIIYDSSVETRDVSNASFDKQT